MSSCHVIWVFPCFHSLFFAAGSFSLSHVFELLTENFSFWVFFPALFCSLPKFIRFTFCLSLASRLSPQCSISAWKLLPERKAVLARVVSLRHAGHVRPWDACGSRVASAPTAWPFAWAAEAFPTTPKLRHPVTDVWAAPGKERSCSSNDRPPPSRSEERFTLPGCAWSRRGHPAGRRVRAVPAWRGGGGSREEPGKQGLTVNQDNRPRWKCFQVKRYNLDTTTFLPAKKCL